MVTHSENAGLPKQGEGDSDCVFISLTVLEYPRGERIRRLAGDRKRGESQATDTPIGGPAGSPSLGSAGEHASQWGRRGAGREALRAPGACCTRGGGSTALQARGSRE